jgi:hypothetical protein
MKHVLFAGLCATTLALSAPIASAHDNNGHRHHHGDKHQSEHKHQHRHSDKGIAVAAGAVALLAIAAAAKSHENKDTYTYHRGVGSRGNAISACLHKAQRRTARRGGYGVTLRKVRRANFNGSSWKVRLAVKQRLSGGARRNVVARCDVVGNRVSNFSFR